MDNSKKYWKIFLGGFSRLLFQSGRIYAFDDFCFVWKMDFIEVEMVDMPRLDAV